MHRGNVSERVVEIEWDTYKHTDPPQAFSPTSHLCCELSQKTAVIERCMKSFWQHTHTFCEHTHTHLNEANAEVGPHGSWDTDWQIVHVAVGVYAVGRPLILPESHRSCTN